MKTAVEWLEEQLDRIGLNADIIGHLTKEAKEIEKQQISNAYTSDQIFHLTSEQYYNKTFNK